MVHASAEESVLRGTSAQSASSLSEKGSIRRNNSGPAEKDGPTSEVDSVEAISPKADSSGEAKSESGASSSSSSSTTTRGLLVLLRHGESMWNRSQEHPDRLWRYAGSSDVALSVNGINEALVAGDRLADIPLDVVFSSNLSRAINTCMISLSKHSSKLTPMVACREGSHANAMNKVAHLPPQTVIGVVCSDALNERNFGDLQGMPSTEHSERFSPQFLKKVRNDFSTRFPGEKGESTQDVYNRVVPYFEANILPLLRQGQNVLLCSHGFTIRALIKYLDGMSVDEFNLQMAKEKVDPENCKLLAATGVPLLYSFADAVDADADAANDDADADANAADAGSAQACQPKKIGAIDRAYELAHTCAPY